MTLFTEGRLQAFERMMQDTGKYHRREDSEDRPRKCPKKKAEPASLLSSLSPQALTPKLRRPMPVVLNTSSAMRVLTG